MLVSPDSFLFRDQDWPDLSLKNEGKDFGKELKARLVISRLVLAPGIMPEVVFYDKCGD